MVHEGNVTIPSRDAENLATVCREFDCPPRVEIIGL